MIRSANDGDVDHDGSLDVVAKIGCRYGAEWEPDQVVAFHRRPDGTFATVGLVVQVDGGAPNSSNEIKSMFGFLITANGEIRVEVGDFKTAYTDPGAALEGVHQFRTYGWIGTTFVQTAGSTSFVVAADAVDLSVKATPMVYAKPVNGVRAGTMTVTIRNEGAAVDDVSMLLFVMSGVTADGCTGGEWDAVTCPLGRLGPGVIRTVTFHHSIPSSDSRNQVHEGAGLQVRIGDQKFHDVQGVPLVYR